MRRRFSAEFRQQILERYRQGPGTYGAKKALADEVGLPYSTISQWLRGADLGIAPPQQASGRVHEFRTVDGQLQQLGADGWRPYVPFERLRAAMRGQLTATKAQFLADFEQLWQEAG